MSIRKAKFKKTLFFVTVFFLFNIACYVPTSTHSEAYATPQKFSKKSQNYLVRTSQAMADVVEAVKPAIVNISTTKTIRSKGGINPFFDDPFFKRFFGDQFEQQRKPRERKATSLGSGVIVTSDGYILTNNHVVKDADEITVLLSDKREFEGKIIASDPKTDISVIKIEAEDLPTISWGDSDKLKVGSLVLAIGSPYGLNQTVTMGIVSAVGRSNVGITDYEDFIQTDAAINPGNSGGALVNAEHELVGINTAIFSTSGGYQGIGFAIPSNMAKRVLDSLIETGKVVRGWLGVSVQPITSELAKQFQLLDSYGALVAEVIEDSPAKKAGILRGDVIVEFNNEKVDEPSNLRNTVADTSPGEKVKVVVIRDGKHKNLWITITELQTESDEKAVSAAYENALRGISTQELTPDIYRELNLPQKIRGVVVSNIAGDSPAIDKLMRADVILEINRKAISSTDNFKAIVSKIKSEEDVLLLVYRRGATVFVSISGIEKE